MESTDLTRVVWRKSSFSGNPGMDCVEVADALGRTAVRDSKNPTRGMVVFDRAGWRAFVVGVRSGDFS